MPKPWDQEHIAELIEMLQELLEAADLDDKEAIAVCAVLLPKLQERSGLDGCTFRSAVTGALHHRPPGPLRVGCGANSRNGVLAMNPESFVQIINVLGLAWPSCTD